MTSLDFDHLKILVADDDFQILSLVAGRAKKLSSNIVEAHDGEEALALAKKHRPDLVVLDVMMPGLSGWEVCRAIREEEGLEGTRILMLTGIGERLNAMTSPLYGADDFLDKPFDFDELDARMRDLLERERS